VEIFGRKPLIVYVSGAPGSGKTTLASKIATELYLPHISSDLVHAGVRLTKGSPNDRHASLHDVFVPLLLHMARANVSFVVDQVLQQSFSERDIIAKLREHAQIVNVHTVCHEPIARHAARELSRTDRGVYMSPIEVDSRANYHKNNLGETSRPLELTLPQIIIQTDDGYNPSFPDIIAFIEHQYSREDIS